MCIRDRVRIAWATPEVVGPALAACVDPKRPLWGSFTGGAAECVVSFRTCRAPSRRDGGLVLPGRGLGRLGRKYHLERRPATWRALHPHRAAVGIDDPPRDVQAQALATGLRIRLPAALEDAHQLRRTDALSRVSDPEADLSGLAARTDLDASSGRSELHGVVHQVEEY